MRRISFLVAIAAVALLSSACFPVITPPGNAPLRYRDMIFSNVTTTSNITYGSATDLSNNVITLQMDEYAPTGDAVTSRPVIIWVHGGSFCCGDKTSGEIVDESNNFAKRGYVNFSINYRLEPTGCSAGNPADQTCIKAIGEAMQDAQTAIRFVRAHAVDYGIDPTRVAIGGSSAGAITAMNVAYDTSEVPDAGVRAGVSLSGADILAPETPGDAPTLLFHGTADTTVPYQWGVDTRDNAVKVGDYSWLTTFDGAGHVPYAQFHDTIITQTQNFLYWELDLQHAAQ